jgi:Nickel responsive protein SCO4226-like
VAKYLVELYSPTAGSGDLPSAAARARSKEVARSRQEVRYLRSIFVPGDELCFLLYEGPSAEAVAEAVRQAAITFDRIVPVAVDGGD